MNDDIFRDMIQKRLQKFKGMPMTEKTLDKITVDLYDFVEHIWEITGEIITFNITRNGNHKVNITIYDMQNDKRNHEKGN